MSASEQGRDDAMIFRVVVNDEEQYSIWPATRPIPGGWRDAGKQGPRADCLAHIATVWTDMRPLSVRVPPSEEGACGAADSPRSAPLPDDDLVARLAARDHVVEPVLHPDRSVRALRQRLERGSVYVRFFGDRGTTDLPIRLAPTAAPADVSAGTVHIEGSVTLNGVAVLCTAEIAIDTLRGTGRLRRATEQGVPLG